MLDDLRVGGVPVPEVRDNQWSDFPEQVTAMLHDVDGTPIRWNRRYSKTALFGSVPRHVIWWAASGVRAIRAGKANVPNTPCGMGGCCLSPTSTALAHGAAMACG